MRHGIYLAAAFGLLFSGTAQAVTITGTTVGKWGSVVDTTGVSVYSSHNNDLGDLARFNWGTTDCPSCATPTTPFDNQFTFDGVGSDGDSPWVVTPENAFLLGEFTYRNGSTMQSIGVSTVDLSVALNITAPVGAVVTDTFTAHITNTPNNTGNPVTDGDIVTISDNTILTPLFTYLDVNYYLEVLGFSRDNGRTITSNFSSPEGQTAAAGLYARIMTCPPTTAVPEPSSMLLLGLGACGFFSSRRRSLPIV